MPWVEQEMDMRFPENCICPPHAAGGGCEAGGVAGRYLEAFPDVLHPQT